MTFVQKTILVGMIFLPCLHAATLDGIDVSDFNGVINWSQVASAGKKFAFIRSTQGTGGKLDDDRTNFNVTGARAAGLTVGVYHLCWPNYNTGTTGAIAEADHFLANSASYIGNGYLPPALDLETEIANTLSSSAVSTWVLTWLQRVEQRTGVRCFVYTSQSTAARLDSTIAKSYPLWVARYGVSAGSVGNIGNWDGWMIHQYTSSGTCAGVPSARVDLDVFNGSAADLQALAAGAGSVPPVPSVFTTFPDVSDGNVGIDWGYSGADPPTYKYRLQVSTSSALLSAQDGFTTSRGAAGSVVVNHVITTGSSFVWDGSQVGVLSHQSGGATYYSVSAAPVPGTTYYYIVYAYDTTTGQRSTYSPVRSFTATSNPPATPTGLAASDSTYTDQVRLTWSGTGAERYYVYRNTTNSSSGATQLGYATTTSYQDTTATAGARYFYWIKSWTTAGGYSNYSVSDAGTRGVAPVPAFEVNVSSLTATVQQGGNPQPLTFTVKNSGTGTLSYSISDNVSWLSVSGSPNTSTGATNTHTISFSTSGMSAGTFTGTITVSATGLASKNINVTLTVSANSTASLALNGGIVTTPSPIQQGGSVIVSASVANSGGSVFTGDFKAELLNSGGTYLGSLGEITGVSIPSNGGQRGLSITTGSSIVSAAGSYQVRILYRPTGGSYATLAAGSFSNPISTSIVSTVSTTPVSRITSPTDGAVVTQSSLSVAGTSTVASGAIQGAWVSLNGGTFNAVQTTTNWTTALTLVPGLNTIQAKCRANSTMSAVASINVTYVPQPNLEVSYVDVVPNNASVQFTSPQVEYSGTRQGGDYFQITNRGEGTLKITSVTSSNPDEFTILGPSDPNLPSQTADYLYVAFDPSASGLRGAWITVQSNDPDTPAYNFFVQGYGVDAPPKPDLRDAGSQWHHLSGVSASPGETITIESRVENAGAVAVPSTVRVSYYASSDTIIDGSDTYLGQGTFSTNGLAPGGTIPVAISVSLPSGLPAGHYYIGWMIDAPLLIDEEVENNNTGLIAFPRLSVGVSSPFSLAFTSPSAGAVLAPGQTVTLQWSSNSLASDASMSIGMFDGWNWRVLVPNTPNDGQETITIPADVLVGLYGPKFSIEWNGYPTVFAYSGIIRLGTSPEIVVKNGSLASDLEVSDGQPTVVSFGTTTTSLPVSRVFRVENSGAEELVITSVSAPSGFQVVSFPTSLASGASGLVEVSLIAGTAGTYSGNLTIQNNDLDEAAFDVPITGAVTGDPSPVLASAVDASSQVFGSSGNAAWFYQSSVNRDGVDAAQSGDVGDSQTSSLSMTVNGPANVSFYWKVSSETGFDFLRFYLDGTDQGSPISGNVDWQQRTVSVTSGTHALRWSYVKDDSISEEADAGWVDQISFGAASSPLIVVEDSSGNGLVDGGSTVSFVSTTVGSSTSRTFTIRNSGSGDLNGLSISKDGSNSADFAISTTGMLTTLVPGNTTTFTVFFSPSAAGERTAALHISSNDGSRSPFDISLTATANPPVGSTLDGTTLGRAVWGRPNANGGLPPSTLSTGATTVAYDVISFTVSTSGTYNIRSTATSPTNWDNYLILYGNAFNPGAPLLNALVANDDYPGIGVAGFSCELTAGSSYFAVTTGYSNGSAGAYTLDVAGPGSVQRVINSTAALSSLSLGSGASLAPAFAPDVTSYSASIPNSVSSITVTPAASQISATVRVNGILTSAGSGTIINLGTGTTTATIVVTAQDSTTKTYAVAMTRGYSTETKAQITSPANGSSLTSTALPLVWNTGSGVSQCILYAGTSPGGYDLYAAVESGTTRTLTVPADKKIYVTLWSLIKGAYQANHYVFNPLVSIKAVLGSPANGSSLSGSTLDLAWYAGLGCSKYVLWMGSSPGGYDLGAADAGAATSRSFSVPQDGGPVYLTLWSLINGAYQSNSYWFTTAQPVSGNYAARLTSPVNATALSSPSLNLAWDAGAGVSSYALWVGSKPDGYDLYAGAEGSNTSKTVAIPGDGRRIYVTLHSLIGGAYQSNAYWFTAPNLPDKGAAQITAPAIGSTLGSTTLPLTWSAAAGASQYILWAGDTPTGYNRYAGAEGSNLNKTITVPGDGSPVYATLYSLINGSYLPSTAWFTTTNTGGGNKRARLTSPGNGSTLSGSQSFTWDGGVGLAGCALWIGSSPNSYDLLAAAVSPNSNRTVTLPTDGRKIYATLHSLIGGAYQSNGWFFTAASVAPVKATITSPADGSVLSGSSATFNWTTGVGAAGYALWIGRKPGGFDVYAGAEGLNSSKTISAVPVDGGPVYVTLWSLINGAWQGDDHIYQSSIP